MLIRLFQDDLECYFWTRPDIDNLRKNNPESLRMINAQSQKELNVSIGDNDFSIVPFALSNHNSLKNLVEYMKLYDTTGVNVIVFNQNNIHNILQNNSFDYFIDSLDEVQQLGYKFIIIQKTDEDFFIWEEGRTNRDIIDRIAGMKNVMVFTDSYFSKADNFVFHPKLHIQNWHNSKKFDGVIYEYGNDLFNSVNKEYRIGLHINRINKPDRRFLDETFDSKYHSKLLYSSKLDRLQTTYYNNLYDVTDVINDGLNTSNYWYTQQFLDMTIKSEMELVYETFTIREASINIEETIKWNEKTIKHLLLGKPFIHTDPMAHFLMEQNGFISYHPLFTKKLLSKYESKSISKDNAISITDIDWLDELKENIDWLLNMDEVEWRERIREANDIAKQNMNRCRELIFNTSLIDYIPKEFLECK